MRSRAHVERLIPAEKGQLPLRGLSLRRKPVVPLPKECDVQAAMVRGLRMYGLRVLVTSRTAKRVMCAACHAWFWNHAGDGATKGLPDLFVRRSQTSRYGRAWPPLLWIGIEVKPHKRAQIKPEQQELRDAGDTTICMTFEEALAKVKEIDSLFEARS